MSRFFGATLVRCIFAILALFSCTGACAESSPVPRKSMPAKKFRGRLLAKNAATPPLMPPRQLDDDLPDLDHPASAGEDVSNSSPSSSVSGGQPLRLALEGGVQGRSASNQAYASGMPWYWGGQISVIVPVWEDRIWIRPGAGYFTRSSSNGYQTLAENIVEPELNLQYAFLHGAGFQWSVGAVQSVQVFFNRVSNGTLSSWSPVETIYRVGPSTTLAFSITKSLSLIVDGNVTFNFNNPTMPAVELLGGITFGF